MQLDLEQMLAKVRGTQWALADFDWEQPGADLIPQHKFGVLKEFMADLTWIEQIGSRGFYSMAKNANDETLAEIYRLFAAEEQRHANCEVALMRRWGMLEEDEEPVPNKNIQLVIWFLDRHADDLPLSVLGSVIPMLEIALDGALLTFLLDEVEDPLCHQVFERINADEARHLGVDFHVIESIGAGPRLRNALEGGAAFASPVMLFSLGLGYVPLIQRARDLLVAMGVGEERLYDAMLKYKKLGDRNPNIARNPMYQLVKNHALLVVNSKAPYRAFTGAMTRASRLVPRRLFARRPAWIQLTSNPFV